MSIKEKILGKENAQIAETLASLGFFYIKINKFAEAETFFKENPDQFKSPEQVRASHILLQVKEGSKEEEVKAKRAAADQALARVKKGEPFDKLATEISEDPSAKENHGDLNFFGREQMVPEFSEAAFKLKKGEISPEPVRSDFGSRARMTSCR